MSSKPIGRQFPKVTICLPVRNGALTIQRTLDSLLNQDYPNYEIIVSDNCSVDDTAKIVAQYASKGVKYFFNPVVEKWGGAESNWNHILTLAEGPFIALYHADDIYTSTMVRCQVEHLLQYPEASAVFTMSQTIDSFDRPIKMGSFMLPKELKGKDLFQHKDFLNYTLKYGTFAIVPTMMTKRDVLWHVGSFNWKKYATAADIDLYLRMAKIGPIGIIDEPLHKYRISSQQASAQLFRQRIFLAHSFKVLDDHISLSESTGIIHEEALAFYQMRRAADQIRCALNMLVQNRVVEAKEYLKQAVQFKHITYALKMSALKGLNKLALFLMGSILFVALYIHFDSFCAKCAFNLFEWRKRNKRKPITRC